MNFKQEIERKSAERKKNINNCIRSMYKEIEQTKKKVSIKNRQHTTTRANVQTVKKRSGGNKVANSGA